MSAYYNEIDPFAARWLRNLIAAGHIAEGEVDERSIEDVLPGDLAGFTQCHFFAGIGGWSLALKLAGWSDTTSVWTGSCPCQPFSAAGKGGGLDDPRHLWPAWHHLITCCRPVRIFGEQVASRDALGWWDVVHADLEDAGYACGAVDLCAAGVGAPIRRSRLFFVADANCGGWSAGSQHPPSGHRSATSAGHCPVPWAQARLVPAAIGKPRLIEPGIHLLAHGVRNRVERLRAYGNAIVPPLAAEFVRACMECRP